MGVDGSASRYSTLSGRCLGEFVVGDLLGEGAFGEVYRARQPALDREAAVKILRAGHRSNQVIIQRFMREARLASRLDHPFAAHVYAFGAEPDGLLWIAMEFVRGTPLSQLLQLRGPMTLERLTPLIARLCEVVHSAHEQGIVHRDIKPSNVMVVSRAGQLLPKLLDFGISKSLVDAVADDVDAPATSTGPVSIVATERGARVGSPAYLAPELWRDSSAAGARTDLYALGVLAFEALTGELPFRGSSPAMLGLAHARAPMPALPPELPAALGDVLRRALDKRPDARFASVLEFGQAFVAASQVHESSASIPQLDPELRATWIANAPQPLAEAVAALEAARNMYQAAELVRSLIHVAVHYLGLLGLACRGHAAPARRPDLPSLTHALTALQRRSVTAEEWVELAREACRAFVNERALFPLPEMVALFFSDNGAPLADGPVDRLMRLGHAHAQVVGASHGDVAAQLERSLVELPELLRALSFVLEYQLVVVRNGRAVRWMGLRRPQRVIIDNRGALPANGEPALLGRDGLVILSLHPLVQVAEPSPGAPEEMFLLEGKGRHGARLVAVPVGFERHDESPWQWLRDTLTVDAEGDERESEEVTPFRGLAAFTSADAGWFFGREREAVAFANRLQVDPMLAVVGASGAGKSSFVQAGVLPLMPDWRAFVVRPGTNPTAALTSRLVRDGIAVGDGADLGAAVRRAAEGAGIVLVIDQFEELFTLCHDVGERKRFVAALSDAARSPDDRVRVVITLRDDFLMRAQELTTLRERLARGVVLLPTPSSDDLRRILTEPARRVGYAFEDDELVERMTRAVADQPAALALLSFTAARLWELRDRTLKKLTAAAYERLGGIGGALGRHAEETVARMPAHDQKLVRGLFAQLVTAEGTRALFRRDELVETARDRAGADTVIEQLVAARLLVIHEGDDEHERIELAHEALIGAWPRLQAWRREDADGARLRDQLRAAAEQWNERGRSRGLLWRGDALVELERWLKRTGSTLGGATRDFAAASRREAALGRRIRRGIVAILVVALASGLAIAHVQRTRAERLAAVGRVRLAAQYVDQGRQALLDGSAGRALVYLNEALQLGADGPVRRFLFARAAASYEAERVVLRGHAYSVFSTAFAPDGQRVVTASTDGTARLWTTDGRLLQEMKGHADPIQTVAFSPDGTRIATGSNDRTARIWDGHTGALLFVLAGHKDGVIDVAFAHDGARLATSSSDHTARIWDVATGRLVTTLAGHDQRVRRTRFSSDGRRIVTAGFDKQAIVWDARTFRPICRLPHDAAVTWADFTPDQRRIATSGKLAYVWDATTCKLLHTLVGHRDALFGATFSPDGKTLATASVDKTARLWDVEHGTLLATLEQRTGSVQSVDFSPDGNRLVTAGGEGIARIFDVRSGALIGSLEGHTGSIQVARFSPDGKSIVTASDDKTARIWSAASQVLARTIPIPPANFGRLAPDGRRAVIAGVDGITRVIDLGSGETVLTLDGHKGEVTSAAFSADGRRIVTTGIDKTAHVWDASDGKLLETLAGHEDAVEYASFSPSGALVATSADDKTARIWDATSGKLVKTLTGHVDGVTSVVFTRDGRRAATSSWDRSLTLWDTSTWNVFHDLGPHAISLTGAAFSPDGRRVVASLQDGTAVVWDVERGTRVGTVGGHVGEVKPPSFAPDGSLFATGGNDGTVRLWDAESLQPVEVILAHAQPVDDTDFVSDGTALASFGRDGALALWTVPHDCRDATHAAAFVRCHVGERLEDGKLVPRPVEPAACAAAARCP